MFIVVDCCLLLTVAKVAYTFDAGPNAVLYALSSDIPEILALVTHFFPPAEGNTQ